MHDERTSPPRANEGWPQGPPTAMPVAAPGSNTLLFVAIGCAALTFMSLCAVGVGAVAWGALRSVPASPIASAGGPTTMHIRAQITSYVGSASLPVGSICELPIEQVLEPDGTTYCHVRLTCSGVPLYGSDENGFFPCTTSPGRLSGQDMETTMTDRDGAFLVNTDARVFEAHDDAMGPMGLFAVTGTIIAIE